MDFEDLTKETNIGGIWMKKQLGLEVLDYPFLGYREIMAVLKCTATVAYEVIDDVMNGKDENGSPLVDQSKMPPFKSKKIPTSVFCKKYGIRKKLKK